MGLNDKAYDHSSFSKNRERLLQHAIGQKFFQQVLNLIKQAGLMSDEHFTVDGTLIEAWASMKSFKPKGQDTNDTTGGLKNPSVDFHGEQRSNQTHQSTTDSEARLLRKATGKEAKLCHALHLVNENRHGFITNLSYSLSVGTTESEQALKLIKKLRRMGFQPDTVGADKGYHNYGFIAGLRKLNIKPHVACKNNTHVKGIDRRTTRHKGYSVSQVKRKLIEQVFGWFKTRAQARKTNLIGITKNEFAMFCRAVAYNIIRFIKLQPEPVMT
jgi:hypothetical protein